MKNSKYYKFLRALPVLLLSVLILQSCATSPELKSQDKNFKPQSEQTHIFTHKEDGKSINYEVIFKDDKIISLYRDGVKIQDPEIKDYEDIIYNKLNRMRKEIKDDDDVFVFKFNSDEFKEKMMKFRDKFKEDEFRFEFDKEKFKADMDKLKEELKKNKIVINLDKEMMQEHMKELKDHLKELELIRPEIDINLEDLKDEMNKIKIKIKIKKDGDKIHKIETEKLEKDMKRLKREMGDLSVELEGLEAELEKLDTFLKSLKQELVKDNLISSVNDDLEMEMSEDKMIVNSKEVTEPLFSKYKKMYEEHFDKKLEGKQKFQIK